MTDHPPYSRLDCPACGQTIRVRRRFDHFEIHGELGRGGMSCVFLAKDLKLDRDVALKILNSACSQDERRMKAFEREAEMTAQFTNPNVVKVFKVGHDQGLFYIAMELVDGGSLEESIRAEGKVPEARVLEIGIQTVQGLKAAQAAGLIHRDIKPGNILFMADGTPKLVDFGLAMFSRDGEKDNEIWATPFYVPPETLFAEPEDFRSDMYALGASLYHAAVGKPPYAKDSGSLEELRMMKSRRVDVTRNAPHLHPETRAILQRCMERKPADRYATYDEFLDHLQFARRRVVRGGKGKWSGGRSSFTPAQWGGIAAAGALLIGGAVWLSVRGGSSTPQPAETSGGLIVDDAGAIAGDSAAAARFLSARADLIQGSFSGAREGFSKLVAASAVGQPTLSWAQFNAGLCSLLAGDNAAAQTAFTALGNQQGFGSDAAQQELQGFFRQVAERLGTGTGLNPDQISAWRPDGPQCMGLLAAGLQNWNAGHLEIAGEWFRAFAKASPPPGHGWITDCRRMAAPWLADATAVMQLPAMPEKSAPAAEVQAALDRVKEISAKLTLSPARERATTLAGQLAALLGEREQHDRMASSEAESQKSGEELSLISQTLAAAAPARPPFDFAPLRSALTQLNLTTKAASDRRAEELALLDDAAKVLPSLSSDLKIRPLAAASVERPDGTVIRGEVSSTDAALTVRLPGAAAKIEVPLTKLPPATVVDLTWRLSAETPDSDASYRRWEMAIAFALRTGCLMQAQELGTQLAQQLPAYAARWEKIARNNGFSAPAAASNSSGSQ